MTVGNMGKLFKFSIWHIEFGKEWNEEENERFSHSFIYTDISTSQTSKCITYIFGKRENYYENMHRDTQIHEKIEKRASNLLYFILRPKISRICFSVMATIFFGFVYNSRLCHYRCYRITANISFHCIIHFLGVCFRSSSLFRLFFLSFGYNFV